MFDVLLVLLLAAAFWAGWWMRGVNDRPVTDRDRLDALKKVSGR